MQHAVTFVNIIAVSLHAILWIIQILNYSIRNFKVSPTTIESGEKAEQQLTCNYSPKLFRPLSSIELPNLTDLSKMKMRRDLRSARSHDEFFNTRGLSHLMNAINMINAVCLRIGLEIHAVFQSEDRCIYMRWNVKDGFWKYRWNSKAKSKSFFFQLHFYQLSLCTTKALQNHSFLSTNNTILCIAYDILFFFSCV